MAEFLLELLSEEIPAGMQAWARKKLQDELFYNLGEEKEHLVSHSLDVFSTPRRLTVCIKNMADTSEDSIEERKGPRIDAPQQALDGFLRSCGMKKEDLKIEEDKKGKFYVAEIIKKGRPAEQVLAEVIPEIIRTFSWPKSMLWGEGNLRWVRPLHSILAILDGKQIDFEIGGIKSGNRTHGHFFDPKPIVVKDFADYHAKLEDIGIIFEDDIDFKKFAKIGNDAQDLCHKKGLKLIEDHDLLYEATRIVESPWCIMGKIDKQFLELPPEVLQTSMKNHQKFLSVENSNGQITHFIIVANKHNPSKEAEDTIRKGNERVLSARLADAKFFWENDLRHAKDGMKDWQAKLEKMTFHNELGTQAERVNRIVKFARTHADLLGVKPDEAETVARLMKLDLCSEMVREFPELQGVMASYYANESGYFGGIGFACREHYAPLGQHDNPPSAPLSILMALADKLDMLAGFWSVGITPTSSGDKFALRRATLGVIRIILDNNLRLSLTDLLTTVFDAFPDSLPHAQVDLAQFFYFRLENYLTDKYSISEDILNACRVVWDTKFYITSTANRAIALHHFIKPDDYMPAMFNEDSEKLEEIREFQNLLQGFKRAHNILHAEQKKDGVFYEMPPEPQYFQDPTETELHTALNAAETTLPPLMEKEQFAQMLQTLANLRAPIDAFFTQVQVNSDQSAVRRNRLCLLHKLCSVMKTFADFSRLNG